MTAIPQMDLLFPIEGTSASNENRIWSNAQNEDPATLMNEEALQ